MAVPTSSEARNEPPRSRCSTTRMGSSGCSARSSITTNDTSRTAAAAKSVTAVDEAPAVGAGLGEAVDEGEQAAGDGHRAGQVVAVVGRAPALAHHPQSPPPRRRSAKGTLMSSVQRHEAYWVRKPPRMRPTAAPAPEMPP